MADKVDNLQGPRPEYRPPSFPMWLNLVVIGLGAYVTVGYTQRLFEGRRPSDLEWLLGLDMGSWWWAGQLLAIAGWGIIISLRIDDLMRRRERRPST